MRLLRWVRRARIFLHRHHHLNHVRESAKPLQQFSPGSWRWSAEHFAALDVRIAHAAYWRAGIKSPSLLRRGFRLMRSGRASGRSGPEFANRFSVQLGHRAVNDFNRRFPGQRFRAFHCDKAFSCVPLLNKAVLIHRAFRRHSTNLFRSHESASWVSDVGRASFSVQNRGVAGRFCRFRGRRVTATRRGLRAESPGNPPE